MARGGSWHQQLSIDFSLYSKRLLSFWEIIFADEEGDEAEEPDEALQL